MNPLPWSSPRPDHHHKMVVAEEKEVRVAEKEEKEKAVI
jgi:hypothetical protein